MMLFPVSEWWSWLYFGIGMGVVYGVAFLPLLVDVLILLFGIIKRLLRPPQIQMEYLRRVFSNSEFWLGISVFSFTMAFVIYVSKSY